MMIKSIEHLSLNNNRDVLQKLCEMRAMSNVIL
jgi:hypothetical protein